MSPLVDLQKITNNKSKEELFRLAFFDSLTGVLNRNAFEEFRPRFERARKKTDLYVTIVDVNNLKLINDSEGHQAGDRTIKFVADVLREVSDWVFRLGGDEFLLITEKPVTLEHSFISYGSAYMGKQVSLRTAMSAADIKMYQNKRLKRGR